MSEIGYGEQNTKEQSRHIFLTSIRKLPGYRPGWAAEKLQENNYASSILEVGNGGQAVWKTSQLDKDNTLQT